MGNSYDKLLKKRPIVDTEFVQLYHQLNAMPADFNPNDKARIQIFSKRLKAARLSVAERFKKNGGYKDPKMPGPRSCFVYTQGDVAEWLGITPQRVSQYENGKISSIPCNHLLAFYDMFDVTPHYLVGYTTAPDKSLYIDEDGSVRCDENGKYKEFVHPLSYPVLSQKKAIQILSMLSWKDTRQFLTLCKFLNSSDNTMKTGFEILDILLQNEQTST